MSKQDKIVEAARQRFRHYGVGKTTMQEIASDAGVAVGTLYLYFSNKDALVVACVDTFIEHHRRQIAETLSAEITAEKKLRNYFVARYRQAEETRKNSRHAAEIAKAVLRVKPDRLLEEGQMMWDTTVKILEQGVEERQFHVVDVQHDARVLLYAVASFFPNALTNPPIEVHETDLVMVLDWFISAWRRPAAAKSGSRRRA